MRLKEAYRDEELYWHQKSRSSRMQLGDNNSKYFHALTKQRRARNRITGLHDKNGIWSIEDKDVQSIAVSYFKDLFTTTKHEAFEEALAEVQLLITEQINEFITAPATESEVRAALFMMHPEKAPRPDDKDPLEVLRLAEKEAQLWQSAQLELHNENLGSVDLVTRPRVRDVSLESNFSGYRCFVDGSWKENDKFSGTGWFCTSSNGEPPTMGAANLRRSLSPLHTEVEALLWAMKCMIGADNQEVAFFTDCSDLVKMVSSPTEWPAFSVYLEEFQSVKNEFSNFSLSLISRSANVKADNLARKIRTEPLHITYVNNIPWKWLF
ncbi:Ribonuclease H domain [Arabidopsis suecica]|uniref:Ribonuclease H domain n=1 Tax=Arabidopsis suecica TaxID=45249 RepID=A0A8T1ZCQ6_ARASU|nr:Ribonuclease H domain [Arabidopsis suecica]